ncbi:Hypothetical predicted protein [Paramuricea clavata]|uniref:Uncharacterized protein n=1 Tax=Paramuricea clavata TaxID=317549 RepID=A0A7D9JJX8_PARCT|nr:Hypothetical predicted protein [Paramuricea clavata]
MAGRTNQLPSELQSHTTQLNWKGPSNSLLQSKLPDVRTNARDPAEIQETDQKAKRKMKKYSDSKAYVKPSRLVRQQDEPTEGDSTDGEHDNLEDTDGEPDNIAQAQEQQQEPHRYPQRVRAPPRHLADYA